MKNIGARNAREFLKDLLVRELVPVTGCTEAGAVALATGWAAKALAVSTDEIEEINVEVDNSTYKNALGVGIPGTGQSGPRFAAAMGASSVEKVQEGLQILANPDKETIENAQALVRENKIRISKVASTKEILVRVRVRDTKDEASAVIRGSHDHVVGVERNGRPYEGPSGPGEDFWKMTEQVKTLKYSAIVNFIKVVDLEEIPIVREGMELNMRFATEARKRLPSLKIAQIMEKHTHLGLARNSLPAKIQLITALSVEARMKGFDLPVMACAGSGNQGLVATIPVFETARALGESEERLLRALALSYLTTIYIKAYTGLLSPICGCGVAAAVGAGCGMVFLQGGDVPEIEAQINNMVGTMAGIICDGAKSGCALKALMAVGLAVDSTYMSLENVRIPSTDGIVGREVMDTLKNLQQIIEDGMTTMDRAITDVMEKKGTNGTTSEE
jgi:L-cysteine desulfidase